MRSICKACVWEQPIVGVGATSGEIFVPRRIKNFNTSVLYEVETLHGNAQQLQTTAHKCPRWLVTTTINPATANLQALAKLPGWCKVFVLDKKSPFDFALDGPGVVILNVASQEALPWRMARLTPWNHFGRKNLGYVYALLHGAEIIYDTDDDNIIEKSSSSSFSADAGDAELLLPGSLTADASLALHLVPATQDRAFNPYPFWDAHSAWPRGFPLSLINTATARSGATHIAGGEASLAATGQRTCMLQSLANADPDMDAIYRLTQTLPLFFPVLGARLMYPPGVYAPANAQATLISKDLAAALLMPVTVHGRVSDIWRSYILQRVMWDSGCRLTFADPWVKQYRNVHGYQKDFQAELDLYLKAEGMLQVLDEIDFGKETALGPRVLITFTQLYEYGLLEELDVKLAYAYLRDLSLLDSVAQFGDGPPTGPGAAPAVPRPAPSSASSQRAAICIVGRFRGGPAPFPQLKTHLLGTLGMPFDIVVATPDLAASGSASASSGSEADNPDDFLYLLPNVRAVVRPDYAGAGAMAALEGWGQTALGPSGGGHHPVAKLLAQLAEAAACNEGIRRVGITYSHVVRVRADVLVLEPPQMPLADTQPGQVVFSEEISVAAAGGSGVAALEYGRFEDMIVMMDELRAVPELLKKAAAGSSDAAALHRLHGEEHKVVVELRPVAMCRVWSFTGGVLTLHGGGGKDGAMSACEEHCTRLRSCRHMPARTHAAWAGR